MADSTKAQGALIDLLKGGTFLGCLPDEALQLIAKRGVVSAFKKGAVLFERGDEGGALFALLSGKVKVHNVTTDARDVVLNFLGPGDVLGEISALDGRGRTAAATALEATEAVVLQRRDILPVLERHPEALLEILQILCDKLRATSEMVEDNQRTLPGRAARGLLRLARQHGKTTKAGIVIDLGIAQRDLGSYLGMSRENTSRQLAAFTERGILGTSDGKVLVRDEAALTDIAEDEAV